MMNFIKNIYNSITKSNDSNDWEKYFEKVDCGKNIDYDKGDCYYIYHTMNIRHCTKSRFIYRYRNENATKLENNLPMPPTDSFEFMFNECESLKNIDALKNWDIKNVNNITGMFHSCKSLTNIDALNNWDTSNVKDMSCMFSSCKSLSNIDALKNWDTSNVKAMSSMFNECNSLKNIDALTNWDIRNVNNTYNMFHNCKSLSNIDALKNWDISNIINIQYMFCNCVSLSNIDALKNWDTRNVKNMIGIFHGCKSIKIIDDLKNWDTSKVVEMENMFRDCISLTNIDALKNWNTKKVINMVCMFYNCKSLENIDALKNWDTRNVKDMIGMFERCYSLNSYPKILEELKEFTAKTDIKESNVKDTIPGWEKYFEKIVCIKNNGIDRDLYPYKYSHICHYRNGHLTNNTHFVKSPIIYRYKDKNTKILPNDLPMPPTDSFEDMFYNCISLTNIDALKNWDTSNIKNMCNMFGKCISLRNIDALTNWDTRNVKDMNGMFERCYSLKSYPKNLKELKEFTTKTNVKYTNNVIDDCILPRSRGSNRFARPSQIMRAKVIRRLEIMEDWDNVKLPTWT